MSYVGNAISRAATWVAEKAAPSIYEIGFSNSPFAGGVPRRNVALWLREYGKNSRLRGPIHRIALDCAKVRWRMFHVDKSDPTKKTEVHDHPLLRQLFGKVGTGISGRPNPWMSGRKARMLDRIYQEIAGESFIWIRRDKPFGPPIELWPIPPHWVTSIPGLRQSKSGEIVFDPMFRFSFAGGAHEMLMTEIIWRYDPDPANPYWRGLGAAQAVDDEVTQLQFMAKYQNSFFRNNARPDVIVGLDGAKEGELKRMEDWWLSKHAGFSKAFVPAFVNSKTTTVALLNGATHSDMQFIEGNKLDAAIVRQNWNVPPELLGDLEESDRTKLDAAMRFHAESNIVPRADDDAEDWNYYMVPLYDRHPDVIAAGLSGETLVLEYDSPVQETNEFRLKRANEGLTRGAWTLDQYLAETDRPPLGPEHGGSERLIPVNVVVMLPDGTMAAGPGQSQDGQTVPGARPAGEMAASIRPNGKAMVTLIP